MINDKEAIFKSFGALGYDIDRICAIICDKEEEEKEIRRQWSDKNSSLARHYQKGAAEAEYKIDVMLFESASSGDIKSLNELEKRKNARDRLEKRKSKKNGTA